MRILRAVLFLAGPMTMNLVLLGVGFHLGALAGRDGLIVTQEYLDWWTWLMASSIIAYAHSFWIAWRVAGRQWDE